MFNRPERNTTLDQYAATVESILQSLQIDPLQARMNMDSGYGWRFQRGSALIEIYIAGDREGHAYLQLLAPLFHLPEGYLLPLYRRLLELNLQLTNASIGVFQDVVYVFNERPLHGLDTVEVDYVIKQISEYADDLDNQLVNEFGGRLYTQVR
jgi:hypothetical protein